MELVFFETPAFSRRLSDYLDDSGYRVLQQALLENPIRGEIIPGTGGFRKLRWQDGRRSKGKRGGLRVVYYYLPVDHQLWLFSIYDKNEIEDLTAEEKRLLKQAIQKELKARKRENGQEA